MKPRRPYQPGPSSLFAQKVFQVVRAIPKGKILSYGQVAILVGVPRGARAVGGVLFGLGPESRVPWHRVINSQGGISTYRIGSGALQKKRLQKEGLRFSREGRVDLKRHQWFPSMSLAKKWELPEARLLEFHRKMFFEVTGGGIVKANFSAASPRRVYPPRAPKV
jgi:methylated-DNA-protein-cysteine methyltransferase-like protein